MLLPIKQLMFNHIAPLQFPPRCSPAQEPRPAPAPREGPRSLLRPCRALRRHGQPDLTPSFRASWRRSQSAAGTRSSDLGLAEGLRVDRGCTSGNQEENVGEAALAAEHVATGSTDPRPGVLNRPPQLRIPIPPRNMALRPREQNLCNPLHVQAADRARRHPGTPLGEPGPPATGGSATWRRGTVSGGRGISERSGRV
jgi:hypothetical protein